MAGSPAQVLQIDPKNELVFEGPFVDVVTSYIKLTNPLDRAVGFKIKTTVPKCYCVKPSNGYIEPHQSIEVAVMLQPFNYNAAEKFNHKFMIQSIIAPDDPRPTMEQLWKDAPRSKLMDSRLFCLLRLPEELLVEPSRDLVFEGPFVKPITSVIKLINPSSHNICFRITASSPDHFSITPSMGVLSAHGNSEISVVFHPNDFDLTAKNRERMLIQSVIASEGTDPKMDQTVLFKEGKVTDYYLKCVFKNTGIEERIEVSKHQVASSKPPHDVCMGKTDIEKLMAEISMLRQENAALKESDIHLRRTALSDTCRMPTESGGGGHHKVNADAFSNIPPILYLSLALLIGLFLGRFLL
ncbi:Vesicle-associated membrane protein/synaptobrevin-binding protein isoform 3 [Schistosoma japonicum]|uniref:Putative Vesicle-associated membrane protein-associated protein A n=2 Tax=Schistosoma japonicum TaxID=6182 RepID=Q5DDT1_SCHJA|nr:SJCHGC09425 protein [Schistosoma japonicum]KAH8858503.1 Vesicle-associated membrane protein/synaptobrevin-binding protein [Schistosoma japonicum]TNN16814.1 Vesicle-associated membrane protein/synaptobrevin-binding protein isoform 3 [Schistosoma japonicum]CAX76537.1 putative Vesicle-associated membrane protein-associated protein A [Schistosoma japonicum]